MHDMKPMEYISNDLLKAAFEKMEPIFDSGEFREAIIEIDSNAYIDELTKRRKTTTNAFQAVHSDIASRLDYAPFDTKVEKMGERRPAMSIKGTPTKVTVWRKK
jgi:hypothetical protein